MASTSFRDSLNSMGWSRRDPDVPANTTSSPLLSRLQSLNPFSSGGYVRLPTHNDGPGAPLPAPSRREEEEGFFACTSTYHLYSLTIALVIRPKFLHSRCRHMHKIMHPSAHSSIQQSFSRISILTLPSLH